VEAEADKSDTAWQWGEQANTQGPRFFVFQPERPGVERSPICVGPDAQCERSETEHRSRSKSARKRNGGFQAEGQAGIGGGMSAAVCGAQPEGGAGAERK